MEQIKEDLLLGFLTNQIALLPSLSSQYTLGNYSRISFLKIKSLADSFIQNKEGERIILMPGLRGVGKTTLLFQLYEHIKANLGRNNLIYLSCDIINKQLNSSLQEVLEIYENKILGKPVESLTEKTVILIDEAHYDENWQAVVKGIYDRSKNILMVVSGSCSIAIEISPDLTRRMHTERIHPLNFIEYLLLKKGIFPIKDMASKIREALFNNDDLDYALKELSLINEEVIRKLRTKIPNLEIELENFLSMGGFPFTLRIQKEEIILGKIVSVLDKVIYQDIITFYPSCRGVLEKIFPILHVMAEASDKVNYESLLRFIPGSSKSIVSEVLDALEKAGVIGDIGVEGSAAKIARNSSKFYFASPTIRAALLWMIGKFSRDSKILGLLLENAVFNTLKKIKIYNPNLIQEIYYTDSPGEPDFKVLNAGKIMIIEAGWGDKRISQLKKSKSQNDKFSVMVSNTKSPSIDKANNIIFVPKELFLLMA